MKLKNVEEIHGKNNTGSRDVIMQCSRFYITEFFIIITILID